jgi:hypothetical protein
VQGRAAAWALPLLVFAWIIVTVLLRPAIVPNHPWASRRLVPAVLPGFIVMAVWTCGWLTGWLRQHGYDHVLQAGLASACAVALVVPGAMTTFGLGVRDGLGFTTTYSGEIAAVDHMCAAIPRDSAVVIVTGETLTRLAQVVRGMCGEPTAGLYPRPGTVGQVVRGIRQAGRQPVLLAAHCSQLTRYGGVTREIMNLRTRQDTRIRTAPPLRTRRFTVTVCMSEPAP